MKKVIITGANGFIGKSLTKKLLSMDCIVYGVVRKKESLQDIKCHNLIIIESDLNDYETLTEKINDKDIDVFYHFAWNGTFGESFKDYHLQLNNAACAGDALMAAVKIGCGKFVFAGTIVELEVKRYINMNECKPRISCIYGTAKMAAEMICKTLAYQNNMNINIAIIASAYGEGDKSNMIQNVLLKAFHKNQSPKLINGENLYDWIYISDVVDAFIAIGEKGKNFKTYYVGHRSLKTFEEFVTKTRDIVAPDIELKFGELKDMTETDYSLIDLDVLYNDTGFEAKADFEESIKKTSKWIENMENNVNGGGGHKSNFNYYFFIFYAVPFLQKRSVIK